MEVVAPLALDTGQASDVRQVRPDVWCSYRVQPHGAAAALPDAGHPAGQELNNSSIIKINEGIIKNPNHTSDWPVGRSAAGQ